MKGLVIIFVKCGYIVEKTMDINDLLFNYMYGYFLDTSFSFFFCWDYLCWGCQINMK